MLVAACCFLVQQLRNRSSDWLSFWHVQHSLHTHHSYVEAGSGVTCADAHLNSSLSLLPDKLLHCTQAQLNQPKYSSTFYYCHRPAVEADLPINMGVLFDVYGKVTSGL